ncbi:MAG: hypothetical protein U9N77_06125 [Thermodesulfobacteriota bacterium]|nr:hypothetical protein [Thermodesulfobacteriota bacterium]
MRDFKADALPLLIGSLPMKDHREATELILEYTPETPLWAQLPMYREEGMMAQFLPGMPGLTESSKGKLFIDTSTADFDEEYLAFYEEYLSITEAGQEIATSRFTFTPETGRGFKEFLRQIDELKTKPAALKGQVSGPVTFATGVTDQDDKAIFYNDQLRDAAVKHLAMNAKWQAKEFAKRGFKPIIFFDEPGLAGFGTSAFITITKEDVTAVFNEVMAAVHEEGGLAGVHVCANTEWDLLLNSNIDIISFDAYSYFDKFMLYPNMIKKYMERGGILAFGIVPTSDVNDIAKETAKSLTQKLETQIKEIEKLGISRQIILEQSFITPSCGTGSIDLDSAKKVLLLTRDVSKKIRS